LNKIRNYEESEQNENLEENPKSYRVLDDEPLKNVDFKQCEKWGVLTTILPVSEAVRKFLYKLDWCIVVVGDLEKPQVSSKKSQLNYSS